MYYLPFQYISTTDIFFNYSWITESYDTGDIESWWRHQMETFSALLAICAENSPVPGEFSTQRPVTRSFHVYFDLRPNKGLSKQLWGWWFETQSCPLWRHRNDTDVAWDPSQYKYVLPCRISIVTIRRSHDRLMFIVEIPVPVKTVFTLMRGPGISRYDIESKAAT